MKDQLQRAGGKLWNDFRAFSPGQKAVTVVAALALIVGGLLFATWKSSPPYAPLYTNLAASDASAIVDKLNADKVPYQLAGGGTEIDVPQSQVYATRLKMSSAGLPSSSQTGYSLLDKEGVTTSQFKQQIDYQRAIEGELAKTIQAMNGVQAASVHLAIPQQDVFNDGSQKPSAAVMLTLANGTQLTSQQVQSIVYLVSSSVPNMSTDAVTVTDSAGHVLAAPGDNLTSLAYTDTQVQATQDYNNRLVANLQAMLDRTLGPGHAVVTVNSVLDFDKTSTTEKDYTVNPSAPPLAETKDTETYTGNGANAGGTLGAGTPAGGTGTGTSGAGSYKKTSTTVNNALGTRETTTQNAPGGVKKLSIGVLLDGSVKNLNVPGIETLVKSSSGFDATRGDTLAVEAMPFDQSAAQSAAQSAKAAGKAAAAKTAHAQLISLIKQGVLGGLVVALVLGTWLAGRRRKKGGDEPPYDDDLFGEPELPVAPAPAPVPDASKIELQEALSRRRALVTLADEQPDDVARVLSGWLKSREN
jgi:flagellar M-ring protein FliF